MFWFLDANAIIYLVEGVEPWASALQTALAGAVEADPETHLAVSALSRLECRVLPLRNGNRALLAAHDAFFSGVGLVTVPISNVVIDLATELRARDRLGTADALQAASCLALRGAARFVTGDAKFRRVAGLDVELV